MNPWQKDYLLFYNKEANYLILNSKYYFLKKNVLVNSWQEWNPLFYNKESNYLVLNSKYYFKKNVLVNSWQKDYLLFYNKLSSYLILNTIFKYFYKNYTYNNVSLLINLKI